MKTNIWNVKVTHINFTKKNRDFLQKIQKFSQIFKKKMQEIQSRKNAFSDEICKIHVWNYKKVQIFGNFCKFLQI